MQKVGDVHETVFAMGSPVQSLCTTDMVDHCSPFHSSASTWLESLPLVSPTETHQLEATQSIPERPLEFPGETGLVETH